MQVLLYISYAKQQSYVEQKVPKEYHAEQSAILLLVVWAWLTLFFIIILFSKYHILSVHL